MVVYAINRNKQIYLFLLKEIIKSRKYSEMQKGSSVLLELIKKVNKEITSSAYVFNISSI